MENNKEFIEKIESEIKKYDNKSFKVLFYVMDTKGMPSGSLTYIYSTALYLKKLGYNVQMLHSEKEFMGVGEWLGEEYANLPHYNVESDGISVSPSDILIIPEIYSSIMFETRKLPCKRIALLQNFGYLTEMMQPGATWESYGIDECITITDSLAEKIKTMFPNLKVTVIPPYISNIFNKEETPKKLIVNIVSKNKTDVNSVVKPFFWKYPLFKWVCFRDINGLPKKEFSDALKEGCITVWIDEKTDFGYSALESMACGNIVIGKLPETVPDWAKNEDGSIRDCMLWFATMNESYDIVANVVDTYLHNNVPSIIFEESDKVLSEFTEDNFNKNVEDIYVGKFFANRRKELEEVLIIAKEKENE